MLQSWFPIICAGVIFIALLGALAATVELMLRRMAADSDHTAREADINWRDFDAQ